MLTTPGGLGRARRHRARYAAGKYAKLMMFIRKWFGDRMVLSTVNYAFRSMKDFKDNVV